VKAHDPTFERVVVVRRYTTQEEMEDECRRSLEEIALLANHGKRASIFLLGRYRFQSPGALGQWKGVFPMLDITFKTAHASKGLQADYVIVLGLQTGWYAFPSEICDDPLLQLVMPQAESFPNAEERRLFYVAITRARHAVYLLGSRYFLSEFLEEIVEDDSIRAVVRYGNVLSENTTSTNGNGLAPIETCPQCGKGALRKRSGKFGEFFGCSNYPNCRYTRNVGNNRH